MARFLVRYDVSGTATEHIEADSLETAKEMVGAKVNAPDVGIELDEIDTVDFTVKEIFAVTRKGHEMWTTYVMPDDKRGHASALKETPLFGAE